MSIAKVRHPFNGQYVIDDLHGEPLAMSAGHANYLNDKARQHLHRRPRITTALWKGAQHWLTHDIGVHRRRIRQAYDSYITADGMRDIMENAGDVQLSIVAIDQRRHLLQILRDVRVGA